MDEPTLEAMPRAALTELPLGAVRPTGWLLAQLRLQAAGQTGRLPEVWADVGSDSAWLGGGGEDWERGPYYLDGLVPLAHLLGDEGLLKKSSAWIESLLASQRPDGQFGPVTNDDWWPRMVACKVLTQHADATGDPRVEPFLMRYAGFQAWELPDRPLSSWGRVRGADAVLSLLWLYRRTAEPSLLNLARLVMSQTADWCSHLTTGLRAEPTSQFRHENHGPNVAMGLKTMAVQAELDGTIDDLTLTTEAMANLDRLHGQVHGVFSGDEWLAGREPHHGVETCQAVELMFTLEQLIRIHGDASFADSLENVAFNLLPASSDPSMLAHQYHQQANQVRVSVERRDWTYSGDDANVFGLEPHFGCCTANLHQGWPKFTRSLWMGTPDGGLAAISYAPCTVQATISGHPVTLEVETSYPFEETVRIHVREGGGHGTLRLRRPGWCHDARLTINGIDADVSADRAGFITLERTWGNGDEIVLTLPMTVRTIPRDRGAVGVRLGPLQMSLSPGETWTPVPDAPGLAEWHISPRGSWNYALILEGEQDDELTWPTERLPVTSTPWQLAGAPVRVRARAAKAAEWVEVDGSAGPLPVSPVILVGPVEEVLLVPYGSARIRVTELPVASATTHPVP